MVSGSVRFRFLVIRLDIRYAMCHVLHFGRYTLYMFFSLSMGSAKVITPFPVSFILAFNIRVLTSLLMSFIFLQSWLGVLLVIPL